MQLSFDVKTRGSFNQLISFEIAENWCKTFFGVTEREVDKKGRKRGRGMRENFDLELFVRIAFPYPWLKLIPYAPNQKIFNIDELRFP